MTETEKQLNLLIEGQRKQAESDKTVLSEVEGLRKSFERLHDRFDEIHKTAIIHDQKIKVLEDGQEKSEANCKEQRELIWTKIRASKLEAIATAVKNVKIWVFGSMATAFGALVMAIITYNLKK